MSSHQGVLPRRLRRNLKNPSSSNGLVAGGFGRNSGRQATFLSIAKFCREQGGARFPRERMKLNANTNSTTTPCTCLICTEHKTWDLTSNIRRIRATFFIMLVTSRDHNRQTKHCGCVHQLFFSKQKKHMKRFSKGKQSRTSRINKERREPRVGAAGDCCFPRRRVRRLRSSKAWREKENWPKGIG